MKLSQRFKKPLIVAVSFSSIVFVLIIILFQSTGVLSASRQYPKLFEEAKALGIPTTQEELSAKTVSKGENAFPIVKESIAALRKIQNASYVYTEIAGRPSSSYQWKPRTKAVWDKFKDHREKLLLLSSKNSFNRPLPPKNTYVQSVIHEQDINVMKGFASSLANEGKFEEAKKYFVLASLLIQWQYDDGVAQTLSVRSQLNLVDYILTFVAVNPQNPILKQAVGEVCRIALQPHDFRRDYWSSLNMFVFNLDTGFVKVQTSMFSSSYGRSLLWLNLPIVLQATKSDLLRAHLAGYKMVQQDPYSFDVADKANNVVIRELSNSNRLTLPLIKECAPFNIAPRIKPIINSLRLIEGKYR